MHQPHGGPPAAEASREAERQPAVRAGGGSKTWLFRLHIDIQNHAVRVSAYVFGCHYAAGAAMTFLDFKTVRLDQEVESQ